ncbi:universal stress protein [Amycolatopsis mongoliensis]|uniref:Universal stress protein n=1 Tax=Amycolatopsis mongoliensis TaxID=715475 RepID=A0A9Y2JN70_9PSEU|nr:universal stress protein [Amycolatopsis sp. 4-36]WIY00775.1 universal stress protein [Amycolatopsis sp. 4-36]
MTTEVTVTRPVVVGVDGSTSATQAVCWAAREAVRRDLPLVVVHVCALVPVAVPFAGALGAYKYVLVEEGRAWLAAARDAAKEAAPEVRVSTELTNGWAAEHLIGRSTSAELLVLGSRGLGGFSGLLVGSVAVAVASHGHCPVVVVREADAATGAPQDGPVVVGVDESPAGAAAIPFAFQAAATRGVPLLAVHTWMDQAIAIAWESSLATNWGQVRDEQLRLLEERLTPFRGRYPDVPVQLEIATDGPARTLLGHAHTAQLVVVGSRGRGGFRGLLLGSTSQALIHHATCPVAVVPPARP